MATPTLYPTSKERFEDFTRHHPENKLELIGGQLIVGRDRRANKVPVRGSGWVDG